MTDSYGIVRGHTREDSRPGGTRKLDTDDRSTAIRLRSYEPSTLYDLLLWRTSQSRTGFSAPWRHIWESASGVQEM